MKHPVSKVSDILFGVKNNRSLHLAKWPIIELSIWSKMADQNEYGPLLCDQRCLNQKILEV